MEILMLTCERCAHPTTFYTLSELATHRLDTHERPIPLVACEARLALEAHVVGRARVGAWSPDLTIWHATRIQGRNGVGDILHAT